ncbi:hypothetical protein H072_9470 [Dactylellina haptotyla CBS 200.50]|uniref:BTB domain-containing protein n=1 Tax=Dactylellina haptotyla (strain CBS 200.50) TaxID=1284197 RepID=S8BP14_DACHA|nr:hypothetical protein H072_9470 [Dactylellina haptotyla CBS 200.50]
MVTAFAALMAAIRLGDIHSVQNHIANSRLDLNSVDQFDYSPLILASLCGHYEIVEFLLESGARCDRDTFQGERAVYSALNDRIRSLLLKHDYSISVDRNQPFVSLISSLWSKEVGCASLVGITLPRPNGDICLQLSRDESFDYYAHTFILVARSNYFRNRIWTGDSSLPIKLTLPTDLTPTSISLALRYMYLYDTDTLIDKSDLTSTENLALIFGMPGLFDARTTMEGKDRRQKRAIAVELAQRDLLQLWEDCLRVPLRINRNEQFSTEMLNRKLLLLQPDIILQVESPTGGFTYCYGAHKAVIQSDFISTAARFKEKFQSQCGDKSPVLVTVDVAPIIMETLLKWFYTDLIDISPNLALELLVAADMLLIERLKPKVCLIIATQDSRDLLTGDLGYSIFDVARAGWLTGTFPKLDPFCAKFLASHLEDCLNENGMLRHQFEELIKESATRIERRENTDTIELVDDIRYYLNERFRMRFDTLPMEMFLGLDEKPDGDPPNQQEATKPSEMLRTGTEEYTRLMMGFDKLLGRYSYVLFIRNTGKVANKQTNVSKRDWG